MTRVLVVLALLAGGGGVARADVIFSNFGPLNTYDVTKGFQVGGPNLFVIGDAFKTPNKALQLEKIELAVNLVRGNNALTVSLDADQGGLPGKVLETFNFVNAMQPGNAISILSMNSQKIPILNANTQYWLVASTPNVGTLAVWHQNSTNGMGPHVQSRNGGAFVLSNEVQDVFRITGGPIQLVPEPSTLATVATAAVAGAGLWARRRWSKPRERRHRELRR